MTAAAKYYGVTHDWNECGYIEPDGSMLDFSGRHDGYTGSGERTTDHREIAELYEGLNGVDAMIEHMRRGSVRVMPECNGINIMVALTAKQETVIRRFVSMKRGEVIIDIDDMTGKTVYSRMYDYGTPTAEIMGDIKVRH